METSPEKIRLEISCEQFSVPKTTHGSTCSLLLPQSIVDLFRQTFDSIDLTLRTSSRSQKSQEPNTHKSQKKTRKKVRFEQDLLNGYGSVYYSMSSKSNRKLPDIRYTFSPPPMSHVTNRGDKYGARYGSAGELSTTARDISKQIQKTVNNNNPVLPVGTEDEDSSCSSKADTSTQGHESKDPNSIPKGFEENSDQTVDSDEVVTESTEEDIVGLHRCGNRPNRCSEDGRDINGTMSSQMGDRSQAFAKYSAVKKTTEKVKGQTADTSINDILQEIGFLKRRHTYSGYPEALKTDFNQQKSWQSEKPNKKIPLRDRQLLDDKSKDYFIEDIFHNSHTYLNDNESDSESESVPEDEDEDFFEKIFLGNLEYLDSETNKGPPDVNHGEDHPGSFADTLQGESHDQSEQGAVGGIIHVPKHGILQRHPSATRRQASVHFNNEVQVETYSQEDEDTSSSKSTLAHGDGPISDAPNSFIPSPPPVPDFSSSSTPILMRLPSETTPSVSQKLHGLGHSLGKGTFDYFRRIVTKKNGSKKSSGGIKRKDSLTKAPSPTELLRQKQKMVTDKIIKENLSQKQAMSSIRPGSLASRYTRSYSPPGENYSVRNDTSRDQISRHFRDNVHNERQKIIQGIENSNRLSQKKHDSVSSDKDDFEKLDLKKKQDEEQDIGTKELLHAVAKEKARQTFAALQDEDIKWDEPSKTDVNQTLASLRCNQEEIFQQSKNAMCKQNRFDFSSNRGTEEHLEFKENVELEKEASISGSCGVKSESTTNKTEAIAKKDNSRGLGAFNTTPSELFQEIEERDNAEKKNLNIDSFEVTSSFRHPMKRQNLDMSSCKEEPGYWFFRRESRNNTSDDRLSECKQEGVTSMPDENLSASEEENFAEEKTWIKTNAEQILNRKNKYTERCKQKQRLDKMEQWREDNFSNAKSFDNILQSMKLKDNISTSSSGSLKSSSQITIKSIRESFENVSKFSNHSFGMTDPIAVMNNLLCDFLSMMEKKQIKKLPVTQDDLRELELIYLTIVEISKRLGCMILEEDMLKETDLETSLKDVNAPETVCITDSDLQSEQVKNYIIWLSDMLASTACFLYNSDSLDSAKTDSSDFETVYGRRGTVDWSRLSDSTYRTSLQNVLCDLGVVRDSMTCILMEDQSDFESITDLGTLNSCNDTKLEPALKDEFEERLLVLHDKNQSRDLEELCPHENAHTEAVKFTKLQQKFMERQRRKSNLDEMERSSLSHSTSLLRFQNILRQSSLGGYEASVDSLPLSSTDSIQTGKDNFKKVSQTLGTFTNFPSPIAVTNVYLYHFLSLMKQKQQAGLSMTEDDFRELELIYDTVIAISNTLTSPVCKDGQSAADEYISYQNILPDKKISTGFFTESVQAHDYAKWLSERIASTANLLYQRSSTDIHPKAEKYIVGHYVKGKEKLTFDDKADMESCISLQDVFCDLEMIHESMTNVLMDNQWKLDTLTNLQTKETQIQPETSRNTASGYLADTESMDSVVHPVPHRDSIFLTKQQHMNKTRTSKDTSHDSVVNGFLADSHDRDSIIHPLQHNGPFLLNKYQNVKRNGHETVDGTFHVSKVSNRERPTDEWQGSYERYDISERKNIQMPENRRISSDYTSSVQPVFGDITVPSPSISLVDELSLSTWGLSQGSDWSYAEGHGTPEVSDNVKYQDNFTAKHRDWLNSLPTNASIFESPADLRTNSADFIDVYKREITPPSSGSYRDRFMSLPVNTGMSRCPKVFYEMYEKEASGPSRVSKEATVEPGRKPSLVLTRNPSYENDGALEKGSGETEDHSVTSPDYCSMDISDPTTKSDISSISQESPNEIKWSAQFSFPEDTSSVMVNLGPSKFSLNKMETAMTSSAEDKEGSPDRGQRLFGSTQNLERRGEAAANKRKQAHPTGRSMTPDTRSFMMEREVTESQNRKLQAEITTLQTENKLMKEKYNRAQAKISELETNLHDTQEDLNVLQESFNQEISELSARTRRELDRDREQMETKIIALTRENETLKAEVSGLEKQLDSSQRVTDMARYNSEKTKTLGAYKSEITSLKEELNRVKALLEQSERHLREEEDRHSAASEQLLQLTELKNALQQQADTGGSGMVTDKQLKSLEKRLKVTEERLHQERADRANNLSSVEDKLLTDNARLQAVEKENSRQLHREKERNRNLEQRLKQIREENEKLRLAMPFDDSVLLSNKDSYDIPYSSHSNQRAETLKISDDMNYILSQIERQDGIQSGQEEEMIRVLWNKRELAYKQLREWEVQLKELRLEDNNIVDGLKNLRDTYGQAESKLKQMEDKVEDTRSEMATFETTYKEQLSQLVQERHQALARLKTAEDILEAVRMENDMLKKSLSGHQVITGSKHTTDSSQTEALQVKVSSLEGKVSQLRRQTKLLEGELETAKAQLEARNVALQEVQNELELAYNRLHGDGDEDWKQQKIDKLTAQVNSLQVELRMSTEKYNNLYTEKSKLDSELSNLKKSVEPHKTRQVRTETVDSKVLQEMKDSLAEKESRITSLTTQLEDAENQLQKTRQDLYIEQEHTGELEAEIETLQHTVNQRAQMFEALSGTEREQHAQYQLLKETLDSVTQELSHKHAQIISLDVNLSGQKDRTAELERELEKLKQKREDDGEPDREEVRSGDRLRIHELELERSSLKQELSQAYNAIQASEEQFRGLQTENKQLEQEVVKEKTVILQITAEKGEIEQHLEELAEEHDSLIQEKNQAEEDLIKLENKLQEILHKYEAEARRQHGNFEKQYASLTPEAKQIASELDSLRLLLDGKEKEVDMLQDKMNRQLVEIDFLNRKVDLVHNDSIANREDVARMISELTLKMKEAVATREVNQFLAGERTKLQTEKSHIEKELEQERQNTDKRKLEISEVIKKVETSELQQQSVVKDGRNKATLIASLEADLRNANQNLTTTQTENTQLKSRLDHIQEDVKNLTAINATLEKRLEIEQNSLSEERTTATKWKEDLKSTVHEFEILRHEHVVLSNKLATEEQAVETLKKEVQTKEAQIGGLQEELQNIKLDLDSSKGQLLMTKDTVQKLSQDKGTLYQDYEGICRSLTDKERQLNDVKDRTEEKLEQMKREYTAERVRLEQDRTTAERERDMIKQEMDNLNEELKQKEIQLSTFGKTLSDLETVSREKTELESHLRHLEGSAGDSKLLVEGQRKELMSLNQALAKQTEGYTRLKAANQTLQMDLKNEKETSSREIHELKLMLSELKSQQENERTYLNDNLAQTQTQLRAVETKLASVTEARDSLQAHKCLADKTVEDLQSQLSDESTGRRLAEQSIGKLRLEFEDLRNEKTMSEARLVESKSQLSKLENQLKSEQDKNKKLSCRVQELIRTTQNSDSNVKAKDEEVDLLHKEITKLRQMLDTQKQSLTGKMKKATLEFKQQLELVQEDKDKLSGRVQKLATDLDLSREQIANKNKENLKMQEQVVTLEDRVRESNVKLKQAEDSLKMESENQSQMSYRYHEQDEELKRLRSFLAKKVEESGEADKSMWHEMNRVIQELSKQMQLHLDAQKSGNGKNADTQLIQRYKKQLAEVQGDLSTEKSLHQITKTSLQALEEDCSRLRQQLQKLRRREKSPVADRKYKNRMEAINAIIARSQTQAQALLSSGGYLDDISKARGSPHHSYHSQNRPDSPDNSYASDLSIASLPPMPFSQYTRSADTN